MRPSLILAAISLAATTAQAQIPRPGPVPLPVAGPTTNSLARFSIGEGWGGPGNVSATDRQSGLSLSLDAERPLIPNLSGFVDVTHWQNGDNTSHATFVFGGGSLYPIEGTDFYLRLGAGYGSGEIYAPQIALSGHGYSVSGASLQYGGGYDFRTTSRYSIGVIVLGTNTVGGTARHKVNAGTGELTLVSFGLSATARW